MSSDPVGGQAPSAADAEPSARPTSTDGPRSILVCAKCGARNSIRPNPRGSPHCGTCGKPLPWVVDATDATFETEARTTALVLVDLWAPWCGPCRFVSPILEKMARDHAGRLKVIKVNVDNNRALSRRFDAMSIPTMVVLRDGRQVDRMVGAAPEADLLAHVVPHLAPPK